MKKIFSTRTVITCAMIALPAIVFAQGPQVTQGFTTLGGLINSFTSTVVKALGSLFLAAAVVAFFYGIVQYIWALREGNGEKAKAGSTFMVWGLVALFVMFSVWGIIWYFQGIFGIQGQTNVVIPQVQIGGVSTNGSNSNGSNLPVGNYSNEGNNYPTPTGGGASPSCPNNNYTSAGECCNGTISNDICYPNQPGQ